MFYWCVLFFLIPIGCAYMALRTDAFSWRVGITGSCAFLLVILPRARVLSAGWMVVAALLVSILADFFLDRKQKFRNGYLYGMVGFLVAHILCIVYVCTRFAWNGWVWVVALVLLAVYGFYYFRMAVPHIPQALRLPSLIYCLVSVLSMTMAVGIVMPAFAKALYILGIACILFSDTLICESDFAGNARGSKLILPTYYACHIAISMAVFLSMAG